MWLTEAVKEVGTCFSSLSEKQLHIELHCTLTVDHSLQVDLQLCVHGQVSPLKTGECMRSCKDELCSVHFQIPTVKPIALLTTKYVIWNIVIAQSHQILI